MSCDTLHVSAKINDINTKLTYINTSVCKAVINNGDKQFKICHTGQLFLFYHPKHLIYMTSMNHVVRHLRHLQFYRQDEKKSGDKSLFFHSFIHSFVHSFIQKTQKTYKRPTHGNQTGLQELHSLNNDIFPGLNFMKATAYLEI